jgi:hypothetical protein
MSKDFDTISPVGTISPQDMLKEFDASGAPDDSDAYIEAIGIQPNFKTIVPQAKVTAGWRPAKSLKQLQKQINASFPLRKKTSDGIIGDIAHCPGSSDHCPNIVEDGVGIVTAYDITHDPENGCDMSAVTKAVVASEDSRIKYIIYNSKICSSTPQGDKPAWTWRTYSGSNPHDKHAHFSVKSNKGNYDDVKDWILVEPDAVS